MAGVPGAWRSCGPYLVLDASTGETLIENQATEPWFPASLTKLMTTYVALDAVRQGRLTMDTPLVMSLRAARMAPTKMGFEPGTEVTLDNALKMLMVKSPNDIAVMVAEGISGSVEDFADEMNAAAKKLGLQELHFVNPNGLHDPEHVSSARDMAIIARALLTEFPDHQDLFDIGELLLNGVVIRNHNGMLGRYPGADGMKTGFTCSSGFNIVASATRDGHKLIAVVMGWPSARERNLQTAELLERGFAQEGHGPSVADLPKSKETQAPDMRSHICSRRNAAAVEAAEEEVFGQPKPTVAVVGKQKGGGGGRRRSAVAAFAGGPAVARAGALRSGSGIRRPQAWLDRPGARRAPGAERSQRRQRLYERDGEEPARRGPARAAGRGEAARGRRRGGKESRSRGRPRLITRPSRSRTKQKAKERRRLTSVAGPRRRQIISELFPNILQICVTILQTFPNFIWWFQGISRR